MSKFFLLICMAAFGLVANLQGQTVPRFSKMAVANTGAHIYSLGDTPEFEMTKSEDGSEVYTTESTLEDFNYAAIVVRFVPSMDDATPEDMESLLENYLDFLQTQFGVTGSAGYGKGHIKEDMPDVRGMIDYWEDAEGTQYAVKGWVNNKMMAVMMIYGPGEYPHFNVQQMYLDGFRFPDED